MTCLIQWGHKPSKNSKSIENHIFRGPAALKGASLLLINKWLQHSKRFLGAPPLPTSALGTSGESSPQYEIAASSAILGAFQFLPRLMTRLIQ